MTIFFDLDGTLFDTSRDLHAAANQLLTEDGLAPVKYELIRDEISHGSRKILATAYGINNPKDPKQAELLNRLFLRYLKVYEARQFIDTDPFPGIEALLTQLEERDMRWGIVTNRLTALTMPLLAKKGYDVRASCVVCADTVNKPKPSPEPLLHASKLLAVNPENCIYIGDALTDIQAGKAAGMATMIAGFGFVPNDASLEDWRADYLVHSVEEIYPQLERWMGR